MPLRLDRVYNPKNLNDVSKSLLENFGRVKRGRRKTYWDKNVEASFSRVDIVDEKACNDIIQYLAPTLEQHKGCSIIDVHPGVSLFSRKIHEYLKPKWHLLMEPDERYLEPYIQPLLNERGSTYRHTFLAGAHPSRYWESYRQLHDDPNLLPPRPALPAEDPRLREIDPSLLVIGNLERSYKARQLGMANILLHQMPYAALANELFQRRGLVRTLWWIPERIKHIVFARSSMVRTSFSLGMEMGAEPIEVAGVSSVNELQDASWFSRKRAPLYDRLIVNQVADRMQVNGMSTPEGRELLGAEIGEGLDVSQNVHKPLFDSTARTPAKLRAKIDGVRDRMKEIRTAKSGQHKKMLDGIEYPQSLSMTKVRAEGANLSPSRTPLTVDVHLRVINIEANYKDLEDAGADREALDQLKADIIKLDNEAYALVSSYSDAMLTAVMDITEEQIAFYMSPQLTALDRRPFEPLKLTNSDFFPPTSDLALVDLTPKARDLSVPDLADRKEGAKICQLMLRQIFSTKTRSIIDTLNMFAVNAGQDLVPMVPAIYDVRRGGRLNPQHLRTRMVTEEMIEGLVKAYFEWPFRPQTREMLALAASEGAMGVDGEVAEEVEVAEAAGAEP